MAVVCFQCFKGKKNKAVLIQLFKLLNISFYRLVEDEEEEEKKENEDKTQPN